jgi:GntR family histidine utilization transcriptional repressor
MAEMTISSRTNWRDVMAEVERRIYTREWTPGQSIPNEADLAIEFGCARVTVNRALRTLADMGLLDRRRKAGTSVALHPVSKATLSIPLIRREIEADGKTYQYKLLDQKIEAAPPILKKPFGLSDGEPLLHVSALHSADSIPYVIEDRWINSKAIPHLAEISFTGVSANEWLLQNTPFTHGEIEFGAKNAHADEARLLGSDPGTALFVISRTTWDQKTALTTVKLLFHEGYRKKTRL